MLVYAEDFAGSAARTGGLAGQADRGEPLRAAGLELQDDADLS